MASCFYIPNNASKQVFSNKFTDSLSKAVNNYENILLTGDLNINTSQPAWMHLWDVSYSASETSHRELICKSMRRFPGDWLKASPQRRLWDLSGFLRNISELHLRL